MTRQQAIDIIWSLAIVALPLGVDMANTDEDRQTAKTTLGAVALALIELGVTTEEIEVAQSRWDSGIGAGG